MATPMSQSGPQQGNPLNLILSVLAGSGFDKFTSGVKKLADSGVDINQMASLPNFPLLLAGAGLKDSANSLELVKPLLAQLMPPPPKEEEQQDPRHIQAAMNMLSARLSPGMGGIQPAPTMPGMGGMQKPF